MSTWRVSLVTCEDGTEPDETYAQGVVIDDRRAGAHDLIHEANERWSTQPMEGEVYRIEEITGPRKYRVNVDGTVEPT